MYGLRIRNLRIENDYTQDSLAEKLNVSPKTIGSWEREDRLPPVDKLSALAKLFNVTIDYIMGLNQTPKDATEQEVDDLHRILDQGQLTYREEPVSKEAQDAVKALLEGYYWKKGRKRVKHDDNGDKE